MVGKKEKKRKPLHGTRRDLHLAAERVKVAPCIPADRARTLTKNVAHTHFPISLSLACSRSVIAMRISTDTVPSFSVQAQWSDGLLRKAWTNRDTLLLFES